MASKYEDHNPIDLNELVKIWCGQFTKEEFIYQEQIIFNALTFNLTMPTHIEFLDHFMNLLFKIIITEEEYHSCAIL